MHPNHLSVVQLLDQRDQSSGATRGCLGLLPARARLTPAATIVRWFPGLLWSDQAQAMLHDHITIMLINWLNKLWFYQHVVVMLLGWLIKSRGLIVRWRESQEFAGSAGWCWLSLNWMGDTRRRSSGVRFITTSMNYLLQPETEGEPRVATRNGAVVDGLCQPVSPQLNTILNHSQLWVYKHWPFWKFII